MLDQIAACLSVVLLQQCDMVEAFCKMSPGVASSDCFGASTADSI